MKLPVMRLGKIRGIAAVTGGILIHLTLGNLYSFGNLMTYMTSYMHKHVDKDVHYSNMVWVNAFTTSAQGLFMVLGGLAEKRIGLRLTCLLGCAILSCGIALTYFTIKVSLIAVMMTYGFLAGFGISMSYASPLACAMKWYPDRKGLINGLIVAGFGLGALGSTTFQTLYLNPHNKSVGASGYFEDEDILNRVPSVFLAMAGIFAVMQITGVLLLNQPSTDQAGFIQQEGEHLLSEGEEIEVFAQPPPPSSSPPSSSSKAMVSGTDARTMDMLHFKEFYLLWFIYFLNTIGVGYINSTYKSFGLTFITNDLFLSQVGSFAAIFNAAGRLLWGKLMDKTTFKLAMGFLTMFLAILFAFIPLTTHLGKIGFAIFIWLIFLVFSGNFSLMPTVTEKAFGSQHYTANYGIVFTSQVLSGPIVAGGNQLMLKYVGYGGCFIIIAVISSISAALTRLLPRGL